eukprot:gene17623-49048_t
MRHAARRAALPLLTGGASYWAHRREGRAGPRVTPSGEVGSAALPLLLMLLLGAGGRRGDDAPRRRSGGGGGSTPRCPTFVDAAALDMGQLVALLRDRGSEAAAPAQAGGGGQRLTIRSPRGGRAHVEEPRRVVGATVDDVKERQRGDTAFMLAWN